MPDIIGYAPLLPQENLVEKAAVVVSLLLPIPDGNVLPLDSYVRLVEGNVAVCQFFESR